MRLRRLTSRCVTKIAKTTKPTKNTKTTYCFVISVGFVGFVPGREAVARPGLQATRPGWPERVASRCYQLKRVMICTTRLAFSCTPVMR